MRCVAPVIHLRSIFFLISAAAFWTWLSTWPTAIYGGGITETTVSIEAEYGYPLTLVRCYWSAKCIWIEEGGYYTDPTYPRWESVPIPDNAMWTEVDYRALSLNIVFAVVVCSIATLGFELGSRRLVGCLRGSRSQS